jgi:hypothetical protein
MGSGGDGEQQETVEQVRINSSMRKTPTSIQYKKN